MHIADTDTHAWVAHHNTVMVNGYGNNSMMGDDKANILSNTLDKEAPKQWSCYWTRIAASISA